LPKEEEKEGQEKDPNFERRLDEATAGLQAYVKRHLLERISPVNAAAIVDYMHALTSETNPSDYSRQTTMMTLKQLAEFKDNKTKSFKKMTRDDILSFLNRLRKPNDQDPLHHWIGTYNNNVITINRFFRWLFHPLLVPSERPTPVPITNVRKLKRRETEIYKDSDLWLDPDCNRMFFKHVKSFRDKAFHALMLDTSCRPKELMNAKIKDLEFKEEGFNQKIAYLWVIGKSGKRIKKVLIKSLPYLGDWLGTGGGHIHPMPENPDAYIFCGVGGRNLGKKLERHTFSHRYLLYKKEYFPSLLKDPEVSAEDKKIISEKLLTKPMRPYILRHTALTEKGLLIGEYQLRQHADWSKNSKMPQRYLHFGGTESVAALLKAQGIVSTLEHDQDPNGKAEESSALRPSLICVNCKKPNKPEAKFCSNPKCGMILEFKAHVEREEQLENMQKQLEELKKAQIEIMNAFTHGQRYAVPDGQGGYKAGPPKFEVLLFKQRSELEQQEQQQKNQDSSNKFKSKK
jgi:integrase/recombinase XerD